MEIQDAEMEAAMREVTAPTDAKDGWWSLREEEHLSISARHDKDCGLLAMKATVSMGRASTEGRSEAQQAWQGSRVGLRFGFGSWFGLETSLWR